MISVVVAFHGSELCVLDCLKSLLSMDYPSGLLEVIAVDDSCDSEIAATVSLRFPQVILLRNETSQGCNTAKQRGADIASGEVLAYTDADCTVSPSWASAIVRGIHGGADAVTGPVRHQRAFLQELVCIADFPDSQSDERRQVDAFVGCNFAIRRDLMARLPMNTSGLRVGGDRLLSWRLHSMGYKIVYEPEMLVHHAPHVGVSSMLERRLRYGGKALLMRRIDPTLPGGALGRLGPLAVPAYIAFKLWKDAKTLCQMSGRRLVHPLHAPLLLMSLVLCRLLDSVGIVSAQYGKCRHIRCAEEPGIDTSREDRASVLSDDGSQQQGHG